MNDWSTLKKLIWTYIVKAGGGIERTVSGPIVHITNALARAVKSLTVNIEPVQAGSGDPSPTNVRPISGHTSATVTRTGKNLFDKTAEYQNGKYLNADGTTANYSGFGISGYINASPSTSYVVSGVSGNSPSVCCYDKNKQYLGGYSYGGQSSKSFTTPVGTAFIRLTIILSSIDTIQLELGSTATAYEPYQGNTYSVSWQSEAGTVYGGTLDVTNGVLTVDRGISDLGALDWKYSTDFARFESLTALNNVLAPDAYDSDVNAISSIYKVVPYDQLALSDHSLTIIFKTSAAAGKIWLKNSDYTDAETFKSAMSGVQLCYELATPIEITLTAQQIETLHGTNNIWADTGDVTVTYYASA